MRWSGQSIHADEGLLPESAAASGCASGCAGPAGAAVPGLALPGLVRSVRTPEFEGIVFHEVLAKSALNKVPAASQLPFEWTVNPYRGCTHACRYCFARGTYTYLDLDAGRDFDTQVVVKVNVAEVLARELAHGRRRREHVALGTNTDPYQRAEGRYRLMPGIIRALAESGTPLSILTKGTLLARDLPLLIEATRSVPVGIGVSLALVDDELQQQLEPGTPRPDARLSLIRRVREAGLPCGVMVAPVLPFLTDSDQALTAVLTAVAEAGATGVTVLPLHLRPGAREWFLAWLAGSHPQLVGLYRRLYRGGTYVDRAWSDDLAARVAPIRARLGLTAGASQRLKAPEHPAAIDTSSWPTGSLPAETIRTRTARTRTAPPVVTDDSSLQPTLL
jgi:DNA repair photolyase